MKHIFVKGKDMSRPTLLLLHGAGGNENDLLPVAEKIDSDASILGVRGNILEHDKSLFFRRIAKGIFDEDDLIFRTKELNQFLDGAAEQYEFDRKNIVAIGYSNGAVIAASLLFHYRDALRGAILYHPMVPRRNMTLADLSGKSVYITAGTDNIIYTSKEAEELYSLLKNAHAKVSIHLENQGHQITDQEVMSTTEWYQRI